MLQHHARPGIGSYIHPLRIAVGHLCLTEDSPWHHPHQHGIQTRFVGINGSDFWHFPGQRPGQTLGRINPGSPRVTATAPPRWTIEALWQHADRSPRARRPAGVVPRQHRRWTGARSRLDAAGDSRRVHRAVRLRRPVRAHAVPVSPRRPGDQLRRPARTAPRSSNRRRGWMCTCRSTSAGTLTPCHARTRRRAQELRCSIIPPTPRPSGPLASRRPVRHQSGAEHSGRHRVAGRRRAATGATGCSRTAVAFRRNESPPPGRSTQRHASATKPRRWPIRQAPMLRTTTARRHGFV